MPDADKPLAALEEWEDFLKERYPEPQTPAKPFQTVDPEKKKEEFRNYEANARPTVREFYRLNHRHQTYDFVRTKRKEYLGLNRRQMSVWEALEYLNTLVDDSDRSSITCCRRPSRSVTMDTRAGSSWPV